MRSPSVGYIVWIKGLPRSSTPADAATLKKKDYKDGERLRDDDRCDLRENNPRMGGAFHFHSGIFYFI